MTMKDHERLQLLKVAHLPLLLRSPLGSTLVTVSLYQMPGIGRGRFFAQGCRVMMTSVVEARANHDNKISQNITNNMYDMYDHDL